MAERMLRWLQSSRFLQSSLVLVSLTARHVTGDAARPLPLAARPLPHPDVARRTSHVARRERLRSSFMQRTVRYAAARDPKLVSTVGLLNVISYINEVLR